MEMEILAAEKLLFYKKNTRNWKYKKMKVK